MRRCSFALLLALWAGAAQAQTLHRGNGAEPESLDPQFAGGLAEDNILGDLMVGLTTRDAAGKPIPGMADRWRVAPDGKSWTFHLRKAVWSDGAPVTADDFDFAFRRLLDPRTAARTASLLWVLKNARLAGAGGRPPGAPGALGVEVPRPDTLILRLEHPAPYLPELLTLPAAMPLPRHVVERKGAGWARPGSHVSNGPYVLKDWVPNDHITLVRNPRFYDAAGVRIAEVTYSPGGDAEAMLRRLRAGELDMQTPVPATQAGWLKAHMPGALHVSPSPALSYIAINLAVVRDVRVRRALNLAYNREAIVEKVLKLGEAPAYAYVPPGVAGMTGNAGMDFRNRPFAARVAEAQRLMQAAGYGPFRRLRLTFQTTSNPDNRRLAALLQAMLRPVYIDLEIRTAELQTHLRDLRLRRFELASANWYADVNDASNFLDLLRSGNANNYAGYRNPRFDAAMDAAQQDSDAGRRAQRLAAAQGLALADYPWVPLRFPVQSDAVGPRVKGWTDNARDIHRSRWLWLEK